LAHDYTIKNHDCILIEKSIESEKAIWGESGKVSNV